MTNIAECKEEMLNNIKRITTRNLPAGSFSETATIASSIESLSKAYLNLVIADNIQHEKEC